MTKTVTLTTGWIVDAYSSCDIFGGIPTEESKAIECLYYCAENLSTTFSKLSLILFGVDDLAPDISVEYFYEGLAKFDSWKWRVTLNTEEVPNWALQADMRDGRIRNDFMGYVKSLVFHELRHWEQCVRRTYCCQHYSLKWDSQEDNISNWALDRILNIESNRNREEDVLQWAMLVGDYQKNSLFEGKNYNNKLYEVDARYAQTCLLQRQKLRSLIDIVILSITNALQYLIRPTNRGSVSLQEMAAYLEEYSHHPYFDVVGMREKFHSYFSPFHERHSYLDTDIYYDKTLPYPSPLMEECIGKNISCHIAPPSLPGKRHPYPWTVL